MRIGMGYDVHRLTEDRKLIIGGVEIPYEKGLLGHSDADVLLHAIMDALLGAAALGDIGKHFPDTDPAYKGISSMELLRKVGELLEEHSFLIENIDATIIAQAPKMRPHIDTMRKNIAQALQIEVDQVNVKATTEEGLGFTGTGAVSYTHLDVYKRQTWRRYLRHCLRQSYSASGSLMAWAPPGSFFSFLYCLWY